MNLCDVADGSVVDWDFVMPVPFRVSATSLEHRLFNGCEQIKSSLNLDQGVYFREELIKNRTGKINIKLVSDLFKFESKSVSGSCSSLASYGSSSFRVIPSKVRENSS
jgi:hypothetical protein